eukprot:s3183_g11.t1
MGPFLNPRLYCEIAAVNANARKILTFDSDVLINSTDVDDIAGELAQILADSVLSAERQLAATITTLVEAIEQGVDVDKNFKSPLMSSGLKGIRRCFCPL